VGKQGKHGQLLAWAMVDGAPVPAERYAEKPLAERPEAHCPICDEVIQFRVAQGRTAHMAHMPGSCCAGAGESVEHLNSKLLVASELQRSWRYFVREHCPECRQHVSTGVRDQFDEVCVEVPLGIGDLGHPFYADIACMKDGHIHQIIEVVVSHYCSREKLAYCKDRMLPLVEVDTSRHTLWHPNREKRWNAEKPLYDVELSERCEHCETRRQLSLARRQAVEQKRKALEHKWRMQERFHEAEARYRLKNGWVVHSVAVLDIYRRNGKRFRDWVVYSAKLRFGEEISRIIETFRTDDLSACQREDQMQSDPNLCRRYWQSFLTVKRQRAQVDEVSGWIPINRAEGVQLWESWDLLSYLKKHFDPKPRLVLDGTRWIEKDSDAGRRLPMDWERGRRSWYLIMKEPTVQAMPARLASF